MLSAVTCLVESPMGVRKVTRATIVASRLMPSKLKVNCRPVVWSGEPIRSYSTFNAHSATSNSTEERKSGKMPAIWPKVKAFTTFTASGTLVIGAAGLSMVVIYLILSELLSPSGDTQIFNRSVSLIEKDETARALLQCNDTEESKEKLKAYGEIFTSDKWTRNRPIVSTKKIDKNGKAHYFMRFHVESKKKRGLVHIEAVESDKNYQPDFKSMYLDVAGEQRYYLIKPQLGTVAKPKGFLGVNWGPKRN
ncbi:hypothetical protein HG537_0F03350 [Torulaspora globosa]|uniref:Mitochondrial import inner membrane translocase subunit Tim21 n=1 Tax=Torulaspora globosa TaxID=48254 RepID=A0A7H9HV08_9SACH|nr:hypothetical protein HG537_0F03350 [Torulaspora sp. CBS 2947]